MTQNDSIEILREIQDSYSVEPVTLEPTGSRCVIDVDERSITIPPDIKFFSVQYEHRANAIVFEIGRFVNGIDLATQTGVIEFINGDLETGNVGFYPITEIDANSPDKLLFTWKLHNDSTQIAGSLNFIIRFYTLNQDNTFLYNFVTLPGVGKILDTLDIDQKIPVEITPSFLAIWLEKMNQTNANAESARKIAVDSAKLAEAYAKGRSDMPGYETQNAKYYMEMARTIRDDAATAFAAGKNEAIAAVNQAKDAGILAMETAKNEAVQNVETVIAESAETIKAQILEDIKAIKVPLSRQWRTQKLTESRLYRMPLPLPSTHIKMKLSRRLIPQNLPASQPFKMKARSSLILFPKPRQTLLQIEIRLRPIQRVPQVYSVILQHYRHQPRIV